MREWLDHRQVVLVRRSKFRLAKIDHRLEVLDGYLIVYLNIDKVIKIIREKDEPKPALMKAFKLTDVQAEAILNMRLRSLRKLEEMEIKARAREPHQGAERAEGAARLEGQAVEADRDEIKALKDQFGQKTEIGKRRTSFAEAPEGVETELAEAMIEKEPVTVVLSEKGWIRAIRGHQVDCRQPRLQGRRPAEARGQGADHRHAAAASATNGRFLFARRRQAAGGQGAGEPFRLMIDIEEAHDAVELFVHEPGRKLLVAATSGHGFIVPEDEVLAMTRKGKQVLNVPAGGEAIVCAPADRGQHRGHRREPQASALPAERAARDAARQGRAAAALQGRRARRRAVFKKADGLTYLDPAGRTFTLPMSELKDWGGQRAQAGRLPPKGFPKSNKFGPAF